MKNQKNNKNLNNNLINYILRKVVGLVILTIIMVIPINRITSIIKEKELQRREKAMKEVHNKWQNISFKEHTSIEQL